MSPNICWSKSCFYTLNSASFIIHKLSHQYDSAFNLFFNSSIKFSTLWIVIKVNFSWKPNTWKNEACAVGWSDFQFFWNFKNRHFSMDSSWNSKTTIEKVFFDIMRNHRIHHVFVHFPPQKNCLIRSENCFFKI